MPKYLVQVNYTVEGAKGLLKEGGSKRRAAAQAGIESVGGRIESMYYTLGETDAIVIVDMPDHASVAALSIALAASGGTHGKTTVLMTPEEMDAAVKKTPTYRAPGQ